jgi:hypothetical protein
MPRSSAEELAIESRRCQVADLFLRGIKRQVELAQRIGVNRSTISRDLRVLNDRWKESGVRDLDAAKGQELDRLDLLEREAWQAWEKSKGAHETTTTEQTSTGGGERVKAAIRKDEQCGDPRYLAVVQWCIEQRGKLLGLHAPHKVAPAARDAEEAPLIRIVEVALSNGRADGAPANLLEHGGQADGEPLNNS